MSELQIIIPMAGEGQRFQDQGYNLPKPLIPVNGVPMVVRTVLDLPLAYRYVFLVRASHIEEFSIDKELLKYFPEAIIVSVDKLTSGQASTVRLGGSYLDTEKPVLVAACDSTHIYDQAKHDRMLEKGADCLIWCFRNDSRVLLNPKAYGWIKTVEQKAIGISCKMPISDKTLLDHAISGFFTFKSAGLMLKYLDKMINDNARINNEFYMDVVPNYMIENNLDVRVFEVEKYIGWGTPEDYNDFLGWARYFDSIK
jgi:NDP-sugar pyrophosphorylase family protein